MDHKCSKFKHSPPSVRGPASSITAFLRSITVFLSIKVTMMPPFTVHKKINFPIHQFDHQIPNSSLILNLRVLFQIFPSLLWLFDIGGSFISCAAVCAFAIGALSSSSGIVQTTFNFNMPFFSSCEDAYLYFNEKHRKNHQC